MTAKTRKLAWPLLLPTWIVLGTFFVAPLSIMFAMSFREKGPGITIKPVESWPAHIKEGRFLTNYRETLQPSYLKIFARSVWIALATTGICLLLSYPVAYYIAIMARRRWKNLLLALVAIPFWTSFVIRMGAWKLILGQEGVINALLAVVGIPPLEMMYTPFAVLVGLVYGELPFMILPLYASLEKMDGTLLEAAADLGAGPVHRFFRVTIPQTMPGIVAGILLVFIPSIGQFVVSDMLGGSKAALIGNIIDLDFVRHRPLKSALAFELTAIVLLMLALYASLNRKRRLELI
jgi:spermidine/putrescine transport system permease protein